LPIDVGLTKDWTRNGKRAKRDGTAISLLMMDVDNFKKFNDLYGHQAGDICLRSVAHAFGAVARRPTDLPSRYGGEEFALLLPNTDECGCRQIGERLLTALRELEIPHARNMPSKHVTASVGATTLRPSEVLTDQAALIAEADHALYRAKEGGRDRLVVTGEGVEPLQHRA
jgi:diguanylate cyclase (GGDEF)-like protein